MQSEAKGRVREKEEVFEKYFCLIGKPDIYKMSVVYYIYMRTVL